MPIYVTSVTPNTLAKFNPSVTGSVTGLPNLGLPKASAICRKRARSPGRDPVQLVNYSGVSTETALGLTKPVMMGDLGGRDFAEARLGFGAETAEIHTEFRRNRHDPLGEI